MKKTLMGLAAFAVLTLPSAALADSGKTTDAQSCDDLGHSITFAGSKTLWPPNHKMRYFTITATGNPLESVSLNSAITSDEIVDGEELNGSGNPHIANYENNPGMASGTGSASTTQGIRGERSGRGDGRTYTVTATATYDMVYQCTKQFTVFVPHDQGKN